MNYTKGEWKVHKTNPNYVRIGDTLAYVGSANAHLISAAPDTYNELRKTDAILEQFRKGKISAPFLIERLLDLTWNRKEALAKAESS